jgi:hypothetical protein
MNPGAYEGVSHRLRPNGRILWGAFLCIALAGCGPGDPLAMTVNAADSIGFAMWESDASNRLTAQQMADFGEALQETKFRAMAGGATGAADVERASCAMIDGKTVRGVLQMGLSWELDRLQAERVALAKAMDVNAQYRTRPDDVDSKTYLAELHERQDKRLNAANAQISSVQERLAGYGLKVEVAAPPRARASEVLEPASEDEAPVMQGPRKSER